jgi:lipid A 3-O-deacylase
MLQKHLVIVRRNEDVLSVDRVCEFGGGRMMTDVIGRWLAAGLVAVVALGPTAVGAQSIRAGALEWTLAAGGGASLPNHALETVTSVHLLPHVGYFVTGEIGEGALRGNFELLVEPTLIYLDASNSATVVGVAVLPRWLFAASPRVRPYLEMGGGVLAGQIDLRQTNCDVNVILEGGTGTMIVVAERVALTLGVRLHHVSNANRCSDNDGINSVIGIAGSATSFGDTHGSDHRRRLCQDLARGSWGRRAMREVGVVLAGKEDGAVGAGAGG